uniref:hypothetical protein n=1 Tax=Paractinoplanes polyasparticus TaxID=2856853 RepID=UPI001C85CABE|nr:hypothetical protein [Actinoplanes polyasparticus]
MTARRWWWLRLSAAKHIPTWASEELGAFLAARDADRQSRLIGPPPPPATKPKKAEWSLADRQDDPGLSQWRAVPRPDATPRIWDSLPHS